MTRFYDAGHGKVLQFERLLVDEANMTAEELEAVLRQPKLAHGMLGWLREQLNPPAPQPVYTAPSDYVSRIVARSQARDWGFSNQQLTTLERELEGLDHAGPLSPVGVRIWLGSLEKTWQESMLWLKEETEAQGLEYCPHFDSVPTFRPGSEIKSKPRLACVGLDLTLWNPQDGIVPKQELPKLDSWPTVEVPQLLCLNPQLMQVMDGKNFPHLIVSGLVVGSDGVPYFDRDGQELLVCFYWVSDNWYSYALVRSREL